MTASATNHTRMATFWAIVVAFLVLGAIFRPAFKLPDDAAARLAFQTLSETSLIHTKGLQEGDLVPLSVLLTPGADATARDIQLFNAFDLPARQALTDRFTIFALMGLVVASIALTILIRARKL